MSGMARETLSKALKKPHVSEAKADIKRAWMSSRTEKALVTVADLSVNAVSEDVRHKAARTWLEIDGVLGTARREDAPRHTQLVQIVVQNARERAEAVAISASASGVFESAPFAPVRIELDVDQ